MVEQVCQCGQMGFGMRRCIQKIRSSLLIYPMENTVGIHGLRGGPISGNKQEVICRNPGDTLFAGVHLRDRM